MLSLVHPQIIDQAGELRQSFQGNKSFRHVVIDHFLEPKFAERLRGEFPPFDPKQALNEFGEVGRKAVVPDVKRLGRSFREFDQLIRSRDFLSLVEQITGIPELLYDPDYAGGGTHENRHGQDLDPHVDFNYHPRKNLHRRLNLILFLNPVWDPAWGGALELHEDPWAATGGNRVSTIQPIENRCVIFETSEHSWHGFPGSTFRRGWSTFHADPLRFTSTQNSVPLRKSRSRTRPSMLSGNYPSIFGAATS